MTEKDIYNGFRFTVNNGLYGLVYTISDVNYLGDTCTISWIEPVTNIPQTKRYKVSDIVFVGHKITKCDPVEPIRWVKQYKLV